MQPEAKIKKYIMDKLNATFKDDIVVVNIHQSQYASRGVSDILCCIKGVFVALEIKTPQGRLTPLQTKFIEDVKYAGGIAFAIYGKDDLAINRINTLVASHRNRIRM